ncbi:hypothetical protein R0J91_08065 [Micrococcus sp. SIMBA_131]
MKRATADSPRRPASSSNAYVTSKRAPEGSVSARIFAVCSAAPSTQPERRVSPRAKRPRSTSPSSSTARSVACRRERPDSARPPGVWPRADPRVNFRRRPPAAAGSTGPGPLSAGR